MLVVGFVIAYAGVGGPRVVGAANGLQLLYILPSFPPYQPDALGSRLIGLVLAVGLLMIADRGSGRRPYRRHFVIGWPRPSTRCAIGWWRSANRMVMGVPRLSPMSSGAIARPLSSIPPLERPTGPGRRDRAAMQAATSSAAWRPGVAALAELTERIHPAAAHLATAKLLGVTAASLDESAEALLVAWSGSDPAPVEDAL